MPLARWSIAPAFLVLAACGQEPADDGLVTVDPATTQAPPAPEAPVSGPERRILAFGDSLFAGYGLRPESSYPALLEAELRSRGINARIVNAAVSGDTSVAGAQRLAFALDAQDPPPDLVLLELGGNDMLRSLPVEQTRAAFETMLGELKKRGIPVAIMGMRAAPNLGADYARAFDALYPELAKEYGAVLVPFWLETIYRRPELFQADRIHPTREGIAMLVEATADEVAAALPPAGQP